ncbi:CBD9-like protein [Decorospora gaudefroyi]|uniref:CBD9-like protein n=1 Tax=Decorospora gaudefroyi TaxID=184978 RepID=A0A6A5K894_9PLEO|nr:CBD9-like protein [Decorospora gaudefroyi]
MKGSTRISTFGLLALSYHVSAQVASICPSTGVCFKLNIPESTASSGSGDIFFQISAPSDYEWVALGQGSGMANSNMFVVYTSSSGSNVTLSPRTTKSRAAPNFNGDAQVELLEGSGVANGIMTANVKCSNCDSWSGGQMDFQSDRGTWIFGYRTGGPKNSDDTSASIKEHSNKGIFSWDFANAKGGSSVNPLVEAAPSGTNGGGAAATSCIPRPSGTAAGVTGASPTQTSDDSYKDEDNDDDDGEKEYEDNEDDDDDDDHRPWGSGRPTAWPTARPTSHPRSAKRQETLPYCDELPTSDQNSNSNSNAGFTPITDDESSSHTMVVAHGVLACLVFVLLFPAGAIAIRLASFPGIVWLHGGFQIFAYIVYIAAFGLGVYLANDKGKTGAYHPIIGIVVLVLLFFQPMLGWIHHVMFKKHGHRTLWSYVHVWLGRVAVTVGIVNGGLGLWFADEESTGKYIAYGVIAGLVWLAWVAAMVVGERRRKRAAAMSPKYEVRSSDRRGSGRSDGTDIPMTGVDARRDA